MVQRVLLVFLLGLLTSALEDFTQKQHMFTQLRTHFHLPLQEAGSFQQRYWTVDDYWNQGPMFLYICGPWQCPGVPQEHDFPLHLARNTSGRFIVLEHRYYGKSLPYAFSSMLPQLFFYHDVEQTLADIVQFIRVMNKQMQQKQKWVLVGCGYSGALAAWMRTRYPDLVDVAWASSATVVPSLEFPEYDKQVYLSAMKSGQNCVDAIRRINQYSESCYESGTTQEVTDFFNVTREFAATADKRPVLYYVSGVVGLLVEKGHRSEMCSTITQSQDPKDNLKALAEVVAKYNLASSKLFALNALRSLIWTPENSGRQWYWQRCNQLGWLPVPSEYQMRSKYLDLPFWKWYCNAIYDYPGGLDLPNTNLTRQDLNYMGSQIIYSYGDEDPWKWAGLLETENQDITIVNIDCHDCGHCVDLTQPSSKDSQPLAEAKALIQSQIKSWLNIN